VLESDKFIWPEGKFSYCHCLYESLFSLFLMLCAEKFPVLVFMPI